MLDTLPTELLETVVSFLGTPDKAALACTCRRLRDSGWRDQAAAVSLESEAKSDSFVEFLQARRPGLPRLDLRIVVPVDNAEMGMDDPNFGVREEDGGWALDDLLESVAARCPSLRHLSLESNVDLPEDIFWVLPERLHSLRITPHYDLGMDMEGITRLTSLTSLEFAPAASQHAFLFMLMSYPVQVPRSLVTLSILGNCVHYPELFALAGSLPHLRELTMGHCEFLDEHVESDSDDEVCYRACCEVARLPMAGVAGVLIDTPHRRRCRSPATFTSSSPRSWMPRRACVCTTATRASSTCRRAWRRSTWMARCAAPTTCKSRSPGAPREWSRTGCGRCGCPAASWAC